MKAPQWQRITYMPTTPLHEGGERVTESAAHRALARRAAADGMVLLKNEGGLLPLQKGAKIAVFGKAQVDYVKGGGGSGDTTVSYVRNVVDGLTEKEAEGKVQCFQPLTAFYQADVEAQRKLGKDPGRTVEPALPQSLVDEARAFTDTAILTICRFSGEGSDRTGEAYDGDYFLSHEEEAMVKQVLAAFPHAAVVLNTGGMMDTLWFRNDPRVGAALLAWQGGMEGGSAIADVLCGDVCPSGHLADTFAVNFAAYPSSEGFNESEDYVAYEDDVYVGYRYFETIPGAAEKVCYPFGFGLSYTTFALSGVTMREESGDVLSLAAVVTNTGKVAGRQVVQVYACAPQGQLGKPARVLTGFAKTKLLIPGESQQVRIAFPVYAMASYDDLGKVQRSAYVLEKGAYIFYCGDDVRNAKQVDFTYTVAQDRVVQQLSAKCQPHDLKRRLRADGGYEQMPDAEPSKPRDDKEFPFDGQMPVEWRESNPYSAWAAPVRPQLREVAEGKRTLDELISEMTDEQLVHLLGGQPNRGVANTFGFGNLPIFGIPNVMTADGPAGLRVAPGVGVHTTAFPCACLLACTWDPELTWEIGRASAEEVLENGIGVWLAPAINIHRSPLCGRNFEYYSEDPLLTGKMAASLIRGVQSMKVAVSLKHFCCNNKETNRRECDSRLSERALREIYLRAFEICVKEADPWTIMSSYNPMNGVRTSENRELLTDILRKEWGFSGFVTTDWYTHGEQWREIAAGNDLKMGCGSDEHTLCMLHEGKLKREDVVESVKRILSVILRLA